MPTILEATNLAVGYAPRHAPPVSVSTGINLSVESGEFVCLLGPNGAGKSTLLRTFAGQQEPLFGSVTLRQRRIDTMSNADLAKIVSLVLTERITTSLLTVYELVSMGRIPYTSWSGSLTQHDHEIVEDSLRAASAEELARRRLSELSDGERQRCMLARALAQEPALLILDEITAFLDLPHRIEMMHRLQQLAHERDVAVILSTHDLDLALTNADRILLQPKGQRLIDAGPEDLVLSGAFERAFESEGLVFDKFSGSFNRPRISRGTVHLKAEGVEAYWAQRALERTGFRCVPEDAGGDPIVAYHGSNVWTVVRSNMRETHTALSAVVRTLVESAQASRD
jgi:iron complex transport system ATP-binding protein